MQFSRINNITLHYQHITAPEGSPALVFSNSLATDFRIWRDVIVRLVGKVEIITYDNRGHGLSDIGNSPYQLDELVGDLAGLLDFMGKNDVFICGLSVGGMIAQRLATLRSDLTKGLILCDTAAKIGNSEIWDERIQEPVAAQRHPEPLALAPEQALAGVGAPPEASLVLDAGHVEPVRKPVHNNVVRPESAATLVRRFLVISHE